MEKKRSKELDGMLDKFTKNAFGMAKSDAEEKRVCVICHKEIRMEDFKDALSLKEYGISGLCQKCQDEIFG